MGGIAVLKRQITTDHGKKDDSTGPNIDFKPIILFTGYHFRGGITGRSTCSFKHLSWFVSITQAKIDYFKGMFPVNEEIFGFEVTVHNIQLMQVGHTTDHLLKITTGFFLLDFGFLHDVVEKLSFLDVLHD